MCNILNLFVLSCTVAALIGGVKKALMWDIIG